MKRTGIKDVARLAGVSISTVSKSLNSAAGVSEDIRSRVAAAVEELGYVPLHAAQQLRAGRSRLLGMTVINIANPFFADVMAGAEGAAAGAGLRVLVGNSDDNAAKERDHLELFERVQVEGALVAPFGETAPWLARLRARHIPVVLVDSVDDSGAAPSVSLDNVAGGRMATEHLIGLGRTRIAFLGAREEVRQVRERLRGALEATKDAGLGLDITWTERTTPALGHSLGERIAALPPADRPDAIVATNDLLAAGIVQGLLASGLRVPDDIAVVGYDDIEFASFAAVPLTSIRQPAREMGRRAGELLLQCIAGGTGAVADSFVFEPELVVRASTVGRV
jgi:LacI family transcriptional regulator